MIFLTSGSKRIFKRDGISKLVVCEKISVPVVDIAAGSGDLPCLADLHLIIFQIVIPFDDLQIKQTADQNGGQDAEYQDQYKKPGFQDPVSEVFDTS